MPGSPSGRTRPSSLPRHSLVLLLLVAAPRLALAATLHGTVVDPDGRPVAGARVTAETRAVTRADARSDASGRFVLEALLPGTYLVRVVADGLRSDPVSVSLADGDVRELTLALRLAAVAEAIVVSARQTEVPLSVAADSVTVVTRAELQARQVETVADALRTVPGFAVSGSGGRGSLTALFPRGGESDFSAILVDGVALNEMGGGFDLAHLPAGNVERLEIVRGPQSALYGSDAIGAVVHVITRRDGSPTAEVSAEAGSFGTGRLQASSAGTIGAWSWGGGVDHLRSDGLEGRLVRTGERVTNDDYDVTTIDARGAYRTPRTEVGAQVRLSRHERGFPGPLGSDPFGTAGPVDRVSRGRGETRLWSASIRHAWHPRILTLGRFSILDAESDFISPFGRSESGTRRVSGRVQADVIAHDTVGVSAGTELRAERATSTFITATGTGEVPVRRPIQGVFAEARFTPGARFQLATGVRLERLTRQALPGDDNPFAPRPAFPRDLEHAVTPKIAASYFLVEPDARGWTRLRGTAGTGLRAPSALEIAFTDNPALRAERTRSADVGIEQALAGGRLVLAGTAFFNTYDDLIVAVGRSFRDASQFRTDNISNARARGIELEATAALPAGVRLRGTYTLTDSAILAVDGRSGQAPPPFAVGDSLLRRPRHAGSVDALWTRERVTAFAAVRARGAALDVDPTLGAFGGLVPNPGFGVADAGVTIRVTRRLWLFARGANLLDRGYEEILGFPALGRSVMAGARVAAGR